MLSPVEPWVPGGVQADRGIWETEGPREPGLTFPHSSPAEASQQMAELSEVLALKMENYEQQRKEVTQLRVQVMELQRCCWWVRRGICGASSSCLSPWNPCPLSLLSPQGTQLRSLCLVSESVLEETSGASRPVPSSQVGDRA